EWGAPMLTGGGLGATVGAGIGTMIAPGLGTAIGAGVGGLVGGVGGLIGHAIDKLTGNESGQTPSPSLEPGKPLDTGKQVMSQEPPKQEEIQQVALKAKESGKSDKEVEEMITLYHISNAPGWAKTIAQKKGEGKSFDELGK